LTTVPLPGLIVEPQGQTAVVNITDSHGNIATAYSDAFAVNPVSFPDTITSRTKFYLSSEGPWTVSAKVSGVELAGGSYGLEDGQLGTVTLPLGQLVGAFISGSIQAASDINCTANAVTTILTTPSLQLGTYLFFWTVDLATSASELHLTTTLQMGTASGTFAGPQAQAGISDTVGALSGGVGGTIVTITSAGTVQLVGNNPNGSAITVLHLTGTGSYPATCMSWLKIG
jgi:hypothetical protein